MAGTSSRTCWNSSRTTDWSPKDRTIEAFSMGRPILITRNPVYYYEKYDVLSREIKHRCGASRRIAW